MLFARHQRQRRSHRLFRAHIKGGACYLPSVVNWFGTERNSRHICFQMARIFERGCSGVRMRYVKLVAFFIVPFLQRFAGVLLNSGQQDAPDQDSEGNGASDSLKVWAVSFNLSVLDRAESAIRESYAFLFPNNSPAGQREPDENQYEIIALQWDSPNNNWFGDSPNNNWFGKNCVKVSEWWPLRGCFNQSI